MSMFASQRETLDAAKCFRLLRPRHLPSCRTNPFLGLVRPSPTFSAGRQPQGPKECPRGPRMPRPLLCLTPLVSSLLALTEERRRLCHARRVVDFVLRASGHPSLDTQHPSLHHRKLLFRCHRRAARRMLPSYDSQKRLSIMDSAIFEEYGRIKFLNGIDADDYPQAQAYTLFRNLAQANNPPTNSRGEKMQYQFAELDSDGLGCFIRRVDGGAAIIIETGLVRLCVQIGLVTAITSERSFLPEDASGLTWLWHRLPFNAGREFSRETYDRLFSSLSSRQSEIFYLTTNQVLFFILTHELAHLRFGHLEMLSQKSIFPELRDGKQPTHKKGISPAIMKAAEVAADRYGYYQALQASLLAREFRTDFTWLSSVDRLSSLNFGLLNLFTVWHLFDILESFNEEPDETMVPEFYPVGTNDMTVVFNQKHQSSVMRIVDLLNWIPDGVEQLLEGKVGDGALNEIRKAIYLDFFGRREKLTDEVWLFRAIKASVSFINPSDDLRKIINDEFAEILSEENSRVLEEVNAKWGFH